MEVTSTFQVQKTELEMYILRFMNGSAIKYLVFIKKWYKIPCSDVSQL